MHKAETLRLVDLFCGYLCILLHQLGEVVEQAVLGPQEVKLVVPLLFLHELGEKLPAVAGDKLGGELDDVQVKRRDGRRVGDELKLRRRFFGYHCLVNHLGLRQMSLTVTFQYWILNVTKVYLLEWIQP